jgi:hypothetical protein
MEQDNVLRRAMVRLTRRQLLGTVAAASALVTVDSVAPARTAFAAQAGQDDDQVAPRESLGTTQTTIGDVTSTSSASHRAGFANETRLTTPASINLGTPRPDGLLDVRAPRSNTPSICQEAPGA